MMRLAINQPFDLALSLEMGQAFRWRRVGDEGLANRDWGRPPARWRTGGGGWYSGVIGQRLIHIRQTAEGVEYRAGGPDGEIDADLSELLSGYFRLDTDNISVIYDELCRDYRVATMVWRYRGLRLLRQDPWECLVSYICSRSNSVANVHSNVAEIAELSGRRVAIGNDEQYLFPTAGELVAVGAEALSKLRLTGRRHAGPSVFHAATMVDSANLKPDDLKGHACGYEQALAQLRAVNGVGYKIADCVALFALDQLEAFPVDRWVNRAMQQWYADFPAPKGGRPCPAGARRHPAMDTAEVWPLRRLRRPVPVLRAPAGGAGSATGLWRPLARPVRGNAQGRTPMANAGRQAFMMLVDTNVLIDVALDRHPHSQYAVALLDRLAQEPGLGCVAWHTIATFYYIVANARQERMARDFIAAATDFLRVAPTGDNALRYALSLSMADFEDAMQVSAARACRRRLYHHAQPAGFRQLAHPGNYATAST